MHCAQGVGQQDGPLVPAGALGELPRLSYCPGPPPQVVSNVEEGASQGVGTAGAKAWWCEKEIVGGWGEMRLVGSRGARSQGP